MEKESDSDSYGGKVEDISADESSSNTSDRNINCRLRLKSFVDIHA
jgi:hypothetical protein